MLHAITKTARQTTLDFCLAFGRHIPGYYPGASVEYVNPLLSRGNNYSTSNVTLVTYELLSLRNTCFWPDVRFRLEEFFRKSEKTIVFPQDDYSASGLLDTLVFKNGLIVYSPVQKDLEKIYTKSHMVNRFENSLTGYFESRGLERPEPVTPATYQFRKVDLGGRVRNLPSYFGEQGRKKSVLAGKFSELAGAEGLRVDFSDDDSQALLGADWPDFLKKIRFTIASRGGASLTDPSGTVSFLYRQLRQRFDLSDSRAFELAKSTRMAMGDFSAVGPRVIEAMSNQVGLVQPEDNYFEGLVPGEHYLAIHEDLSNSGEIFARMRDEREWVRLVNNSVEFLWSNQHLHFSGFIKRFLRTENICATSRSHSVGSSVNWGLQKHMDAFSAKDHLALNKILKDSMSRPAALEYAAKNFFIDRGFAEKDIAIEELNQIADGLRTGEVSKVALRGSYLFGLQMGTEPPTSNEHQAPTLP